MTQEQSDLVRELLLAALLGVFVAFGIWSLVPDVSWWLLLGTGAVWGVVTFFAAHTGGRR